MSGKSVTTRTCRPRKPWHSRCPRPNTDKTSSGTWHTYGVPDREVIDESITLRITYLLVFVLRSGSRGENSLDLCFLLRGRVRTGVLEILVSPENRINVLLGPNYLEVGVTVGRRYSRSRSRSAIVVVYLYFMEWEYSDVFLSSSKTEQTCTDDQPGWGS